MFLFEIDNNTEDSLFQPCVTFQALFPYPNPLNKYALSYPSIHNCFSL